MAKQNIDIEVRGTDKGAGSLLDSLAMKAKQLRREDALSGEKALGGFLNNGAGGVAQLGMSALGFGALGLVADFAAKSAEKLTESINDVANGKKTLSEVFDTFARGIPIVGSLGAAIANLIDGGRGAAADAQSEADRVKRERGTDVGMGVQAFAAASIKANQRIRRDGALNPNQVARNAVEDAYQDELERINKERDKLTPEITQNEFGQDTTRGEIKKAMADLNQAVNEAYAAKLKKLYPIAVKEEQDRADTFKKQLDQQAELKRKIAEASADAERKTLEKHRADVAASSGLRSSKAQLLALGGHTQEAERMTTADSFNDQIRSLNDQMAKATPEQKRQMLGTIANLTASRDASLDKLNNPVSKYQSKSESAIGGRFSLGQDQILLSQTANRDTAKNTGDLVKKADQIFRQLLLMWSAGNEKGILGAVGVSN